MALLEQGEPAPGFAVTSHTGETVRLADFVGKYLVLWFYPAANTPGCAAQGTGFRDRMAALREANAAVLGVSTDPVPANREFARENDFPFVLLCDETRTMALKYGAVTDREGTAARISYLIDPEGIVARVYSDVDPATHPDQVLADLAELSA